MFFLQDYLKQKQNDINLSLEKLIVDSDLSADNRLLEAMRFSTLAGGKRIRPILFLSAAESLGCIQDNELVSAACALEYVHTYSLIHDDLPAMDDDELRRGKPTCHIQFDEATAILAGDALLTFAFDILSELGSKHPENSYKYIKFIKLLSDAAGHRGMVKGQMLDLLYEGEKITINELKNIHQLKTGAMIRAAVVGGSIMASGNKHQTDALATYADNIGLAFQVMDDILNIEGNPEVMGKSVGTDIQKEKCTYPALMGLENSKSYAKDLINSALRSIDHFDNKADPLREIAKYIFNRKK